ncbi:MAG: bifunctional phosphopantothenoylcysteine decarboxylase/phosphopantothenate--cysteine ligase CoaBC [Gammaproteobacteria bacterium]|nr:bifunctional phosphopantothenoylcysteine decarboxylase/phosphopantothenate--cysteine ligase CoaBC [Gammaproteobacteria bacterium]
MRLANKKILLGVSGSIAAYKAPDLVRRLRAEGAEVEVVLTRAGAEFITALTLQAVSGRRVHTRHLDPEDETVMGHIELARWADLVLIAPASAHLIAKLAAGLADDLLSTLCLATAAPLALAPAMNHAMWDHPATRANIATLERRGVRLFGPGVGDQACGENGAGRMLEPEELTALTANLLGTGPLQGLSVVVTAGPTREPIDPARFVSNRSSGKMGYALANAAAAAGARVTLISGPVEQPLVAGVRRVEAATAEEMRHCALNLAGCDIFIAAAAVADYRPRQPSPRKLKKDDMALTLEMERTPDIVSEIAALPVAPYMVGFAAETEDLARNAIAKLQGKRLDMVVANLVGREDTGFESDENEVTLFWNGGQADLPRASKRKLGYDIIRLIAERYHAQGAAQDS